jgi:AraC family transcriptional regulator
MQDRIDSPDGYKVVTRRKTMKHRIEQKPAFEVIGYTFRTTTVGGENMREIPKFWDRCLTEGKIQRLGLLGGSFGILGLCAEFDDKMESFTYAIGVEAE